MHRIGIVGELLSMVVRRRTFILLPTILTLLIVGVLLLITEVMPAAPFLYPLF